MAPNGLRVSTPRSPIASPFPPRPDGLCRHHLTDHKPGSAPVASSWNVAGSSPIAVVRGDSRFQDLAYAGGSPVQNPSRRGSWAPPSYFCRSVILPALLRRCDSRFAAPSAMLSRFCLISAF